MSIVCAKTIVSFSQINVKHSNILTHNIYNEARFYLVFNIIVYMYVIY